MVSTVRAGYLPFRVGKEGEGRDWSGEDGFLGGERRFEASRVCSHSSHAAEAAAAWRLWRSGGSDTDTVMSSDDAAQQRTTRSPGLQVPPQRWMLGRQLEQVVRHDFTDELNEEAAITNAQVQRAEQMCLARNAKNRAKREKKREKMLAATVDALFMPDMSRAVGEAVCEANANEKADAVARRQGAMHGEHEAMAHSLSGYAGRSDDDGYKERARHWLAIMKHFYERAQEEFNRLEEGVGEAKGERDEACAERDRANAERDRAKAERDQVKAALERVDRLIVDAALERDRASARADDATAALERILISLRDPAALQSLLISVGDHGHCKGDESAG